MARSRAPWDVPDEPEARPVVDDGIDTDGDGHPDTIVVDDGYALTVATDLDGDGIADQVLRIGHDGTVHQVALGTDRAAGDPALGGDHFGIDPGSPG